MQDDVNAHIDQRINDREYFQLFLSERDRRLDERFDALDKALRLQAVENLRRFDDLNGEYKRDLARQKEYVTVDKYEDKILAEANARSLANERINEKFEEYVKRYEQDKRDLDILLAAQRAVAEAAAKSAEENARATKDATERSDRKQSRNLIVMGLLLSLLIGVLNFVAPLIVK